MLHAFSVASVTDKGTKQNHSKYFEA